MYGHSQPYYSGIPSSTREYYVYPEDYPADQIPVHHRNPHFAGDRFMYDEPLAYPTERYMYPAEHHQYVQKQAAVVDGEELEEEEEEEEEDETAAELAELRVQFEELQKERDDLRKKLASGEQNKDKDEVSRLRSKVRTLEGEVSSLRSERDQHGTAISRDLRGAEDEISRLRNERDQLEEALHQAQADFDELSAQFNLLSTKDLTYSPPHVTSSAVAPVQVQRYHRMDESINKPRQPVQLKTGRKIHSEIEREKQEKETEERAVAAAKTSPPRGRASAEAVVSAIVGIQVDVVENPIVREEGFVEVKDVVPSSLAEKAGLRVGDIIEKWNRRSVTTHSEWQNALSATPRGVCIRLNVCRQGIKKQVLISFP